LEAIRIVLGTMPQMLRDIVREVLSGQPDMHIVGEADSDADLLRDLAVEAPDMVVLELAGLGLGGTGTRVLQQRPRTQVLGLSGDGRSAAIYQLRSQRTMLVEVSPQGLRAAIRDAHDRRPRSGLE
jgi:DNA-binding NarL/FixJ family response regulator